MIALATVSIFPTIATLVTGLLTPLPSKLNHQLVLKTTEQELLSTPPAIKWALLEASTVPKYSTTPDALSIKGSPLPRFSIGLANTYGQGIVVIWVFVCHIEFSASKSNSIPVPSTTLAPPKPDISREPNS